MSAHTVQMMSGVKVLWCCVLQVKYRAATVNANEIANNVLSCLVAISSSCPILQYWQASLVGSELNTV